MEVLFWFGACVWFGLVLLTAICSFYMSPHFRKKGFWHPASSTHEDNHHSSSETRVSGCRLERQNHPLAVTFFTSCFYNTLSILFLKHCSAGEIVFKCEAPLGNCFILFYPLSFLCHCKLNLHQSVCDCVSKVLGYTLHGI